MNAAKSDAPAPAIAAVVSEIYCNVRKYPPGRSRSELLVIVVMPHASKLATFQQSAPPAYDIIKSPLNSCASFAAKFTVIACSGRPERYIIFSFGLKTRR